MVNTKDWNDAYNKLLEFKIGKFFKNNSIKATKFYDIVQDRHAKILDIGCNSGEFLISLLEKGFVNLFGIEPEAEFTKNIPKGIQIVNCPAEHILFDDQSFDVVFIYGVLHHLKGRDAWLESFNEIDRVLKTKGHLFIIEPGREFVYRALEISSNVFGFASTPLYALGKAIREERKELYDFIANHKIYQELIYKKGYKVIINKHAMAQWILTAQKYQTDF